MENNKIEEIKNLLASDKNSVTDIKNLNDLKVKYLGKKGIITELNSEIKNIPNEEKKEFGQKVNELNDLMKNDYVKVVEVHHSKKTYIILFLILALLVAFIIFEVIHYGGKL